MFLQNLNSYAPEPNFISGISLDLQSSSTIRNVADVFVGTSTFNTACPCSTRQSILISHKLSHVLL